jgi:hypothetical protein
MAIQGTATNSQVNRIPGISPYFPLTMAVWVYGSPTDSASGAPNYFNVIQQIDSFEEHISAFQPHVVSQVGYDVNLNVVTKWGFGIVIQKNTAGSWDYATGVYNDPGWIHYAVTLVDDGTPGELGTAAIYINGGYQAPSFGPGVTLNGFVVSPSEAQIILNPSSGAGVNAVQLAFPAVWTSALTAAQIATLAKGIDPRCISPGTLKSFCQLSGTGTQYPDLCSSTPFVSSGPPVNNVPNPPILWGLGGRGRGGY